LDKCAVFLNLYLELENEEDRVTFSNFWYKNLKYKKNEENKGLHPKVEKLLNSNRFFAALYDIQRDLYEGKYPFPYKTLRNEATHKRLVLSWYGSLDEEIKSYSLSEFREITYSLLRMVKAAIIYIVGIVTLEETEKELEHQRNKTHDYDLVAKNVFFFDTAIGLSDQLSS
nr:LA2681 family HEPN domain-containing protein [Microcoleaceae cyanobacterium MO_207.B10]